MRLLIDMNLSPSWVSELADAGVESIHWINVGNPSDPDQILFDWAIDHGYVVFTNDLDFGAILAATNASGPSVIQMRGQDLLPKRLVPRLVTILRQFEHELSQGALITVDEKRSRARILPIRRS